jgi:hypothetical protein
MGDSKTAIKTLDGIFNFYKSAQRTFIFKSLMVDGCTCDVVSQASQGLITRLIINFAAKNPKFF